MMLIDSLKGWGIFLLMAEPERSLVNRSIPFGLGEALMSNASYREEVLNVLLAQLLRVSSRHLSNR